MAAYSDDLPPESSSNEMPITNNRYWMLDRRLSVLEERTAPKPKSLIERINAWTGLATFVLALVFTYAFGAWEKLFVSPVLELRTLIGRLTDADIETTKLMQSLSSDPQAQANLGVALRTKKITLLQGSRAAEQSSVFQLSLPEQQLLAYHYATVQDFEPANKLYEAVLSKAIASENLFLQADTYRLVAGMRSNQALAEVNKSSAATSKSWSEARTLYDKAIKILISDKQLQFWVAANTAVEWAALESSEFGSKECGYALSSWASEVMSKVDPAASSRLLAQQIQWMKRNQGYPGHGIPAIKCSQLTVEFMDEQFRAAIVPILKAEIEARSDLSRARREYDKSIGMLLSSKPPKTFTAASAALEWAKREAEPGGMVECAYALANWGFNAMNWFDPTFASRWANEATPAIKQLYVSLSQGPLPDCPKNIVSSIEF